jgi:hypothetical protein
MPVTGITEAASLLSGIVVHGVVIVNNVIMTDHAVMVMEMAIMKGMAGDMVAGTTDGNKKLPIK